MVPMGRDVQLVTEAKKPSVCSTRKVFGSGIFSPNRFAWPLFRFYVLTPRQVALDPMLSPGRAAKSFSEWETCECPE